MPLLCEKRGPVAILTLSRPGKRNAWGSDYHQGLKELLPELERDTAVLCIILTGDEQGSAFCAGADMKDSETHNVDGMGEFLRALPITRRESPFALLSGFSKPIIAAVNGYAVGIGAIITFCCDLIVASERAEWRLPQASLGIIPADAGAVRLSRFVGKGLAMRMAMGFPLKAGEAHQAGLAQWLVPHGEVLAKAMEVANHIASLPPLAVLMTKESLTQGIEIPLPWAALTDRYRFGALAMTEDKREGHEAWREGRKPRFKGR